MNNPCNGPCPSEDKIWAIPAGILNALWSDVYPRVVADAWRDDDNLIPPEGFYSYLNDPAGNPIQQFLTRMRRFTYDGNPSRWSLTDSAKDRFSAVDAYLSDPVGRIPVRWVGERGFDFLLSDQGLDLFVPPPPNTSRALLRYYTFRRTGRQPIGTPIYLIHPISATATDSPTGPGQVRHDAGITAGIIEGSAADPTDPECGALIECALKALGITPDLLHSATPEPIFMDREKYKCVMKGFRCWQLEGATYRGIMVEFPRVVAEAWLEQEVGLPPIGSREYYETYYYQLIKEPAFARNIFAERLETMIDDPGSMRFIDYDPGAPPSAGTPWANHWPSLKEPDIVVTNQGIYFPEVEELHAALGADPGDRRDRMLLEIVQGRAGNPVFTDSMRTNRDG